MNQLIEELNNLARYYSIKYALNCGGCCWFANEIARFCSKYQIPFKIAWINTNSCVSKRTFKLLNHKTDYKHDGCSHIWILIKHKNKYIPINNVSCNPEIIVKCTSTELKYYYKNSQWNSCFEDKSKSKIQKAIRLTFNKYKQRNYENL